MIDSVSWRKSSYSNADGNCVEVAHLPSSVVVRNSREPDGLVQLYSIVAWTSFVQCVKSDDLVSS